jgi:small subunit ribosomal protein S5e
MSDNGEIEVENPTGIAILPKEVTDEQGSVKLFNKAGSLQFPLIHAQN